MTEALVQSLAYDVEADLIGRWQAGDAAAEGELYGWYWSRLVVWLRRRGVSEGRAQDLAQETWLKASRAILRFDTARPLWPWLAAIADHVHIDFVRACASGRIDAGGSEAIEVHPAAGDAIGRVDERDAVSRAVRSLPAEQRAAFVAVAVEGCSVAEAAQRLAVAPPTLRQRLRRARLQLQCSLAPQRTWVAAPYWLRDLWCQLRARMGDAGAVAVAVPASQAFFALLVLAAGGLVLEAHDRADAAPVRPAQALERGVKAKPQAVVPAGARAREEPAERVLPSRAVRVPVPAAAPAAVEPDAGAARQSRRSVVPFEPVSVPAAGVRVHQEAPADADYAYGVAVPRPGGEELRVGQRNEGDERLRPLHDAACDVAEAGAPLTYCVRGD